MVFSRFSIKNYAKILGLISLLMVWPISASHALSPQTDLYNQKKSVQSSFLNPIEIEQTLQQTKKHISKLLQIISKSKTTSLNKYQQFILELVTVQALALKKGFGRPILASNQKDLQELNNWYATLFQKEIEPLLVEKLSPNQVIYFGDEFTITDGKGRDGADTPVTEIDNLITISVNPSEITLQSFIEETDREITSKMIYGGPRVHGTAQWLKLAVLIHEELIKQKKSAPLSKLLSKLSYKDLKKSLKEKAIQLVAEAPNQNETILSPFFFHVDGTLLETSDDRYNISQSPGYHDLIKLLEYGYPVVFSTTNNFESAFKRVIQPIPDTLRKNITFYANGLGSKYLFNDNPEGEEVLVYRQGKELTQSEMLELDKAIKIAKENYEYRRTDEHFSTPFPVWLKEGEEVDAILRKPRVQKRGKFKETATQLSVVFLASRLAADNGYPEPGDIPDARDIFLTDIKENISNALLKKINIMLGGVVSIDVTRKGINQRIAIEDFLTHFPLASKPFYSIYFNENRSPETQQANIHFNNSFDMDTLKALLLTSIDFWKKLLTDSEPLKINYSRVESSL